MPITTGFVSRAQAEKGEGHIHTEKWHRCIEHVKSNSPGVDPYAVCTHSIGYAGSINPEHRTGGRHPSASPKRFKTKEGQRSARAREKAAKIDYAQILKFDAAKKKKKVKEVIESDDHTGSCDPTTGEPTKRSTFS